MKFRKTSTTAMVVALCLVLAGCQAERPPLSPSAEPPPPDEDPFIEIPLDDAHAGSEASLARNFYFIFDGSGSMRGEPQSPCREDQRFRSKLEGAQWAVLEFLTKIPEDVAIGLYLFDQRGKREVVPLGTDNRREFLLEIESIKAGRGTPLADAIAFGTDRLVKQYKQQLGYGEFRLVVVTDGRANKIPEAARLATRYGMPIYAIGLCIEEDHPLRQHAVSYRAADSFDDLARGLEETLAELPAFDVTEFTP
ncbi:MAG: VWA domain-containing protein [bacterium]|nr:VWA domain-containing protein [bacterium]